MGDYAPIVNFRDVEPARSCATCWYTYRDDGNTYCVRPDGPIFYDHTDIEEKVCNGHSFYREVYNG